MDKIIELIEKYKESDFKWHIIIPIMVGIAIPSYMFYEKYPLKQTELEGAKTARDSAKSKFDQAFNQTQNIQTLEEKFIESQRVVFELDKVLPKNISVENVLKMLTKSAQDHKIYFLNFVPKGIGATTQPAAGAKGAQTPQTTYFRENTFSVSIVGTFTRTARFFDEMLQQDNIMNIRNIKYTRSRAIMEGMENEPKNPYNVRSNLMIATEFELVVFTST